MNKSPKKILLVYFNYRDQLFTPLDVAQAAGYVQQNSPATQIKILGVGAGRNKPMARFDLDVKNIVKLQPDVVIFFAENILWSGMLYEGLINQLSIKLKKVAPKISVGMQSYKIRRERADEALKRHVNIDFILRDEAEIPLLDFCTHADRRQVRSLTYRWGRQIRSNPDAPTVQQLDDIPSPYLSGGLDRFIDIQSKNQPSSIFFMQSTRGCPYACSYCFRSVKFATQRHFSAKRIVDELLYMRDRGVRRIFFLDDTFLTPKKHFGQLVREYKKRCIKEEMPQISVMTRPELITPEIAQCMADMNIWYVQLGLQSVNPAMQTAITRPDDFAFTDFKRATDVLKKYGILFQIDVIFGLPGDDLVTFRHTVDLAMSLEPRFLQMKQMYLNPDTLFEVSAKKYAIKATGKMDRKVPLVRSNMTWTVADMKAASDHAMQTVHNMGKKYPKMGFKVVSEYDFHRS